MTKTPDTRPTRMNQHDRNPNRATCAHCGRRKATERDANNEPTCAPCTEHRARLAAQKAAALALLGRPS